MLGFSSGAFGSGSPPASARSPPDLISGRLERGAPVANVVQPGQQLALGEADEPRAAGRERHRVGADLTLARSERERKTDHRHRGADRLDQPLLELRAGDPLEALDVRDRPDARQQVVRRLGAKRARQDELRLRAVPREPEPPDAFDRDVPDLAEPDRDEPERADVFDREEPDLADVFDREEPERADAFDRDERRRVREAMRWAAGISDWATARVSCGISFSR